VFSKEFKREAARLVSSSEKSPTQIAHELGVSHSMLHRWIEEVAVEAKTGLTPTELQELKQLRKDNSRLQMEVEILGKATAFFAKRNQ
jgi:transposase